MDANASLREGDNVDMWKPDTKMTQPLAPVTRENSSTTVVQEPTLTIPQHATIGQSVLIKGEITGSEPLYIEGSVEGSINFPDNQVMVGREGDVKANITAREIIVIGSICGNLTASERVVIRSSGSLAGNISSLRIIMEDGAFFKGGVDLGEPSRKSDGESQAERTGEEEHVKAISAKAST